MNSLKGKVLIILLCIFRKVWPLELLAFISSCHALELNNQKWLRKYKETQNILVHKNIEHSETKSNHMDTIECKTNISSNDRNVQQDLDLADVRTIRTDETQKQQFLQREGLDVNLSHVFRCHMKPKKQYEIDILSKVSIGSSLLLVHWLKYITKKVFLPNM